ncbi:hypothetical protein DFP72DRAFT_839527 [Ephemerocybe angulata]|uniref:F-box domain-containing protein n=1 Tax=Ephemerocybe angulata TaxID=980116 RepID=A0A8H6IHH3_9AGAR|nr:hypothetical protein DFP72DRAFT_1075823 [Tulosesus angulatus]KAF6765715.1 hypothetical protein DFP72DRAFT_839527 [Tulosesus angulatus]
MGKRKARSQKKSASSKKVKLEENEVSTSLETSQQQDTQGSSIAPAILAETPTSGQSGTEEATVQTEQAQGAGIAEATEEGEGVTVPTAAGELATKDTEATPSAGTETTSIEQQADEESINQISTTAEKAMLEPNILMHIFYEIIVQVPFLIPGGFNIPLPFMGYWRPIIDCAARANLQSVCKQWAHLIANNARFWRDIHIDGNRIPSPPKSWRKGLGSDPENYVEPPHDGEVELPTVSDEMSRAVLSVERSQDSLINLVLVDPTYDPSPGLMQLGRPFLPRPGMLELIHTAMDKPMIGSLSIITKDVHFVKDLLDPGVYLDERYISDQEMILTDIEKVSLACDGKEADHFDVSTLPLIGSFNGIRTRRQREIEAADDIKHEKLRTKYKVWPKLHTLRICTRGKGWMSDRVRCALPAMRAPALRHLELNLYYGGNRIWLWTFPYAQLTHLTLATEERSSILLGIIGRCASLENLTITLRRNPDQAEFAHASKHVVLALLKDLSIQIDVGHAHDHDSKVGRRFLDYITTPRLQSLRFITRIVGRAYPIIYLLKRSHCQLRELYLDFYSSDLYPNPEKEDLDPFSEEFDLHELLYFVAPTVETLAIQSGVMDISFLRTLSAPHLQKIAILCFGRIRAPFIGQLVEIDGHAYDVALSFLRWAEKWMKGATVEEKSKRRIQFVAGPASDGLCGGTDAFYGRSKCEKCIRIPAPTDVREMVSTIRAMGGKVNVWWTALKQLKSRD